MPTAVSKDDLIQTIEQMTVLELSDLVKALEEKFGVSAAALAPAAAAGAGAAEAAQVEEQTEFSVILISPGEKKIQAIKEVRSITSLGLKEAKALVDEAPKPVKEGLSKEDAEAIKAKLEAVGAVAEIK